MKLQLEEVRDALKAHNAGSKVQAKKYESVGKLELCFFN